MVQWEDFLFFKKTYLKKEKFKHLKINLIDRLVLLQKYIGKTIYVSNGLDAKKIDRGYLEGYGIDIMTPDYNLFQLYLDCERMGFSEIGIYRDWYFKTKSNVVGGLFISSKNLDENTIGGEKISERWLCVKLGERQEYLGLTHKNLKKYYFI